MYYIKYSCIYVGILGDAYASRHAYPNSDRNRYTVLFQGIRLLDFPALIWMDITIWFGMGLDLEFGGFV